MKTTEVTTYGEGYNVSECGRVFNKHGKELSQHYDGKGNYLYVGLCYKGKPKTMSIHRLVAEHFIDNPLNKKEVNHIDGNKTNNHASNLEWCTTSENRWHSYHILGNTKGTVPMKGKFGEHHNRSKGVKLLTPKGEEKSYGSLSEMTRDLGVHQSVISFHADKQYPYKLTRGKGKGITILEYPIKSNP